MKMRRIVHLADLCSCRSAPGVACRGRQRHTASQRVLYVYLGFTFSLTHSLSLRPNPLEALFARDSHALSKTIRSEAEKRESREWRARERVREIADGVALLKDMAEARCVVVLLALDALIWSGLALLSHPLSIPNMCGCGVLFRTISTNQMLTHSTSGSD